MVPPLATTHAATASHSAPVTLATSDTFAAPAPVVECVASTLDVTNAAPALLAFSLLIENITHFSGLVNPQFFYPLCGGFRAKDFWIISRCACQSGSSGTFLEDTMLKTQYSHTHDAVGPDRGRSRASFSGFPEQVRQTGTRPNKVAPEKWLKPAHMKPPTCASTGVATPNARTDKGQGELHPRVLQLACRQTHWPRHSIGPPSNAKTTKRHRLPDTSSACLVSLSLRAWSRAAPFVRATLGCGQPSKEVEGDVHCKLGSMEHRKA